MELKRVLGRRVRALRQSDNALDLRFDDDTVLRIRCVVDWASEYSCLEITVDDEQDWQTVDLGSQ